MADLKKTGISRRSVLKGSAAVAGVAAGTSLGGFPTVWSQDIKDIEVSMIGTAVTISSTYEAMAEEALGFQFNMSAVDLNTIGQRAITQPRSADLFEPDLEQFPQIFPTGNMQAIDVTKLEHFDQLLGIYKKSGTIHADAWYGDGMNPSRYCWTSAIDGRDFVEPESSQWMTIVPGTFNADTLGAQPEKIGRPIESWAEFVNPEFNGRTALQNFPGIGIMDIAMALQANGEIEYGDKGNMTVDEINYTFDRLIQLKKDGHFRAFWSTFNDSVNLMTSGEVVLQSMWSPAVAAVRARGVPCIYLDLKEGYRAWALGAIDPAPRGGQEARRPLRLLQLVPLGPGRRLLLQAGLLHVHARELTRLHGALGVGLLVRGQARRGRGQGPLRQRHGAARPRPRRRLVRQPHGPGRRVELDHGREHPRRETLE